MTTYGFRLKHIPPTGLTFPWSDIGAFHTTIKVNDNHYPDGVHTPVWSVHSKAPLLPLPLGVHSNHTPNILGIFLDTTPWTSSNHSPVYIHSKTTSSVLQMECTLHCHYYNLVFVHAYTPIPLHGLYICVDEIANPQCHYMTFKLFIPKNIQSNVTSRACTIYALFGFWNPIYSFTRYV